MREPAQDYQIVATDKGVQLFNTESRGTLQAPPGAGKTYIGISIDEELNTDLTAVFSPSILLVKQWRLQRRKFADNQNVHVLCICSEKDVTRGLSRADIAYEIGELKRIGPVTTDHEEIRKFLGRKGKKMIFSTYQSSPKLGLALGDRALNFAIFDEAYFTAVGKNGVSHWNFALKDENLPAERRLFMTPLLKHYRQSKKKREDFELIYTMDNPRVYGEVFFRMTIRQGIDAGALKDYEFMGTRYDKKRFNIRALRNLARATRAEAPEDDLEWMASCAYGLNEAIALGGLDKIITFHKTIDHSVAFAQMLERLDLPNINGNDKIPIFPVSSRMNPEERAEHLRLIKDSPRCIIPNCRLIGVGFDIDGGRPIDAIYPVDPIYSEMNIINYAGRAMRKDRTGLPNPKKLAHILLPTHMGPDENVGEALYHSSFRRFPRIVNTFAESDDLLQEELIARAKGLKVANPRIKFDFDPNYVPKVEGDRFIAEAFALMRPNPYWERAWRGDLNRYLRYRDGEGGMREVLHEPESRFLRPHRDHPEWHNSILWLRMQQTDIRRMLNDKPCNGMNSEYQSTLESHFGKRFWVLGVDWLAHAEAYEVALKDIEKNHPELWAKLSGKRIIPVAKDFEPWKSQAQWGAGQLGRWRDDREKQKAR